MSQPVAAEPFPEAPPKMGLRPWMLILAAWPIAGVVGGFALFEFIQSISDDPYLVANMSARQRLIPCVAISMVLSLATVWMHPGRTARRLAGATAASAVATVAWVWPVVITYFIVACSTSSCFE